MNWQINSTKSIDRIIPGSLCYLVRDGKVLLIQRRNPPHVGLWSPPGGKMNPGESPQDCVVREFYEETGLTLRDARLQVVTSVLHAGLRMHWLLFIYSTDSYNGELKASDEGDIRWIELSALGRYPRPTADVQMFKHILAGAPLTEMQFSYDVAEQLIEPTSRV